MECPTSFSSIDLYVHSDTDTPENWQFRRHCVPNCRHGGDTILHEPQRCHSSTPILRCGTSTARSRWCRDRDWRNKRDGKVGSGRCHCLKLNSRIGAPEILTPIGTNQKPIPTRISLLPVRKTQNRWSKVSPQIKRTHTVFTTTTSSRERERAR